MTMADACCARGRAPARPVSRAVASLLPGAMLMLLPKCPLCLAAWLAAATGIAIPAADLAPVRVAIIALWLVSATLALAPLLWRRLRDRSAASRDN